MTFNTKDTMRPMTSAIYTYMNQYGTKWNSIMAYGVLLILPCCIIFLTMLKHAAVITVGLLIGIHILKNTPREVQPSILAASSSSLGILRKPGLNIKTTNGIEIVAVDKIGAK